MESTITIPLTRYEALVKKETVLDKVLAAAQKYFEEGLLEC
jgi:hypothetical protein